MAWANGRWSHIYLVNSDEQHLPTSFEYRWHTCIRKMLVVCLLPKENLSRKSYIIVWLHCWSILIRPVRTINRQLIPVADYCYRSLSAFSKLLQIMDYKPKFAYACLVLNQSKCKPFTRYHSTRMALKNLLALSRLAIWKIDMSSPF